MAVIEAGLESHIAALSDRAFDTFCEDISGMFDTDVRCTRLHAGPETLDGLSRQFKKLVAVHLVQATGVLDGTFQLLFDQGGLFVLSGVVVMLPESRVIEEVRRGDLKDAEHLTDAAREVGNLLVGSWDRVFREQCEGHEHFRKIGTYIGKPWDTPGEIALSPDQEVSIALYEMTVDSYPSFHCAVLFPNGVLGRVAASETVDPQHSRNELCKPGDAEAAQQDSQKHLPAGAQNEEKTAEAENTTDASGGSGPSPQMTAPGPGDVQTGLQRTKDGGQTREDRRQEANRARPPSCGLLDIPASEIMDRDVVWCESDDTVQGVAAKMQQHNSGYVLVGRQGALEGLVSNSSILGAISPYLRPTFAKWRRREDDATLAIKVKWVMSRSVRTVNPETTLASMIETMCRYGGRCLPVADEKGKVHGMVTVFDILLRILETDRSSSCRGKPPQGPPLLT